MGVGYDFQPQLRNGNGQHGFSAKSSNKAPSLLCLAEERQSSHREPEYLGPLLSELEGI